MKTTSKMEDCVTRGQQELSIAVCENSGSFVDCEADMTRKPLRGFRDEGIGGFTFIELVVALAILGILAYLSLSNYRHFKTRAANTVALSDYRNLKIGLTELSEDPDSDMAFFSFGVTGPDSFTSARHLVVSSRVRVNYAYHWSFNLGPIRVLYILLELRHLDGDLTYRYWNINGTISEQVIQD